MIIDAWWFNNTQCANEVLQPDFFTPKTHAGLYADGITISFPVNISIIALIGDLILYERQITVNEAKMNSDELNFDINADSGLINGTIYTETLDKLPEYIEITIHSKKNIYSRKVKCEYAVLSGKTTDFLGEPFPAAVILSRLSFGGSMGVWSNQKGEYSVIVPQGIYNTIYADDESYGVKSLENWCWRMIIDRDEVHDFKVGNGEVYSLCTWSNNGGFSTLFIYFRPMVLHKALSLQKAPQTGQYQTMINDVDFTVTDISPMLEIENITASINGYKLKNISIQRIYETDDTQAMPAYILQVKRLPEEDGYTIADKQTLIIEYDAKDDSCNISQGQGRTQFFYNNANMLSFK